MLFGVLLFFHFVSRSTYVQLFVTPELRSTQLATLKFVGRDHELETFGSPGVLKGGDVGELRALFVFDECI